MYIYIYVCPSRFWNAIKLLCDVIAENLRTSGNLLPDFDHRYRYIIYVLIDVLKKRWWSRKCCECTLKTTMSLSVCKRDIQPSTRHKGSCFSVLGNTVGTSLWSVETYLSIVHASTLQHAHTMWCICIMHWFLHENGICR